MPTMTHEIGICPGCGSGMHGAHNDLAISDDDRNQLVLYYNCVEPHCRTIWKEFLRLEKVEVKKDLA